MFRLALQQLIAWKERTGHQPLLIDGARQVGKTWLMKEFGRTQFERTVYVNFEADRQAHAIFSGDIVPDEIIRKLGYRAGH